MNDIGQMCFDADCDKIIALFLNNYNFVSYKYYMYDLFKLYLS